MHFSKSANQLHRKQIERQHRRGFPVNMGSAEVFFPLSATLEMNLKTQLQIGDFESYPKFRKWCQGIDYASTYTSD